MPRPCTMCCKAYSRNVSFCNNIWQAQFNFPCHFMKHLKKWYNLCCTNYKIGNYSQLLRFNAMLTVQVAMNQALTLAMCPLSRMPFWGCRASSGHHNLFSAGPVGFFYNFFFLVLRIPPLFLLGIGKTRKTTLIRTSFSLYRPNVQKCVTSRVKS